MCAKAHTPRQARSRQRQFRRARVRIKKNLYCITGKGFSHKINLSDLSYNKSNPANHNVQPFYSWLETIVSVQHSGRSPGLKIITLAIFPVSQWYSGFCSLITVTSSYRICTCFPFHRSQSFTKLLRHLITTYLILFNISYSYKIFNHFYTGVLFALRLIYSWRYGKLCTFQHQWHSGCFQKGMAVGTFWRWQFRKFSCRDWREADFKINWG